MQSGFKLQDYGRILNTKEQRKQRCTLKAHGFVFFVPLCLKEIKRISRLHSVRNMSK